MAKATATVQMDERGRVVVPKAARKKMGIDGQAATIEIEVRVDE
jgi:bifunctional DNA-binding transcriptional regulator/antitoxin component of YhaV-PrlF toxin-antitoxin module